LFAAIDVPDSAIVMRANTGSIATDTSQVHDLSVLACLGFELRRAAQGSECNKNEQGSHPMSALLRLGEAIILERNVANGGW